jgi:hypothetical protein
MKKADGPHLRAVSSGSTCVNHRAVAQRAFGSGSDGFLPAQEYAGGRTHSEWSEVRVFIMPWQSSVFAKLCQSNSPGDFEHRFADL